MSMLYNGAFRGVGFTVWTCLLMAVLPVQASPVLSYEALIQMLNRMPTSLEADALYEAAEARVLQTGVLLNPTLALESANAQGSGPYAGYKNAETTLTISQPLELWGKRGSRTKIAEAQANVADLRRVQSRWAMAGRIAQIYADAEVALRRYELVMEVLSLAQSDKRAVQVLVSEGRQTSLQVVQADRDVALAQAQLDEALANRDVALARLSALTWKKASVSALGESLLDRTPSIKNFFSKTPLMVRVAQSERDVAASLVVMEQRKAYPDVSVSLGVTRFEDSRDNALSLGLSLSIPLFDRNTNGISAARAEQKAAEARLTASLLEAEVDRRSVKARLDASESRIRAADSGTRAAKEGYRLARIAFDAGRFSLQELSNARLALLTACNSAIDSRLERVRAEIDRARLEERAPFMEVL